MKMQSLSQSLRLRTPKIAACFFGSALVLFSGFLLIAQDQQKQPPLDTSKTKQERQKTPLLQESTPLPISGPVESWYKIYSQNIPVGFIHCKIEPLSADQGGKYRYDEMVEFSIQKVEQKVSLLSIIKATLDADFIPADIDSNVAADSEKLSVKLWRDRGATSVTCESAQGITQFLIDSSEPFYANVNIALHAIWQKGLLKKNETLSLGIMDLVRGVYEVEFKYMGVVKKRYLNTEVQALHVQGQLAQRMYHFYLDRYGRILEVVPEKEGFHVLIVSDALEAQGTRTVVHEQGRRDPFAPRLTPRGTGKTPHEEVSKPKQITLIIFKKSIPKYLKEIESLKEKVRQSFEAKDEKAVEASYQRFILVYGGLLKIVDEAERVRLQQGREEIEELIGGAKALYAKAVDVLNRLKGLFEANHYDDMSPLQAQLKQIDADPSLMGTKYKARIDELLKEVEHLMERVAIRKELASKDFVVSGIVHYIEDKPVEADLGLSLFGQAIELKQTLYFPVANSYAIVSGQTVKSQVVHEGDVIEGITVQKINKSDVVFSYKEEAVSVFIKY